METERKKPFEEFAILELFGHQRIAGKVTEEQIAGASFVRVDVPDEHGRTKLTKFLNPTAIYGITPVDENVCIAAAKGIDSAPIQRYQLEALAKTRRLPGFDDDEDDPDQDRAD